ncbi:hypothetical protein AB0I98_39265 [Streptomyces sp. NPDC050211]|uniref:hypothetical protein n=1 Tax=Streptomyces sp. NPDC050211 TaxID=3154932 RepID=UPI00344708C2
MVSTVVGGGIATVSAGVLERRRWRRERGEQQAETRRVLYGSYLAAVAKARHTISLMARETETPLDQRRRAVWDAFEPCVGLRYELSIVAPQSVVVPAEDVFRRLQDLLNSVSAGVMADGDEYARGKARYGDAHTALTSAMRSDLGAEP